MQATTATQGDDFLPNLCQGWSVLMLVLVSELLVLTMVLAASGISEFAWETFALTSLFVLWVVLTSAGLLCAFRPWLNQLPVPAEVVLILLLVAGVTSLFSLFGNWALQGMVNVTVNGLFLFDDLLRNLLVSSVMTGMVLRYFYIQMQLRRQERAELHARIQALQLRINPHFLFNSMNSIASLISIDQQAAERAVEDLCELFRASLRESLEPVPLAQELELCQRYLTIEKLRLGERLQVDWAVGQIPEGATLPLLAVQPILENAVYHGVQPLPDGGTVRVELNILQPSSPCQLEICITNPLPQAATAEGSVSGHHMALDNIRERLMVLYAERASLKCEQRDGCFVACIRVPMREV